MRRGGTRPRPSSSSSWSSCWRCASLASRAARRRWWRATGASRRPPTTSSRRRPAERVPTASTCSSASQATVRQCNWWLLCFLTNPKRRDIKWLLWLPRNTRTRRVTADGERMKRQHWKYKWQTSLRLDLSFSCCYRRKCFAHSTTSLTASASVAWKCRWMGFCGNVFCWILLLWFLRTGRNTGKGRSPRWNWWCKVLSSILDRAVVSSVQFDFLKTLVGSEPCSCLFARSISGCSCCCKSYLDKSKWIALSLILRDELTSWFLTCSAERNSWISMILPLCINLLSSSWLILLKNKI